MWPVTIAKPSYNRTSTQHINYYGKDSFRCIKKLFFFFIFFRFQYRKPDLVVEMERETLKILQDVETETDEDVELMKQLYGVK